MSETPRTDEEAFILDDGQGEAVMSDFARQLERELAAKDKAIAKLLDAVCPGNNGDSLKVRCQAYEAHEQSQPCPAGLCVFGETKAIAELESENAALREALEYACEAEWDGLHEPAWMKNARAALKGSP